MAAAGGRKWTGRWLLRRMLVPTLPGGTIRDATRGLGYVGDLVGGRLLPGLRTHGRACPSCGQPNMRRVEDAVGIEVAGLQETGHPALFCDACGFVEPVSEVITSPRTLVVSQNLVSQASFTGYIAVGLMVVCSVLGLYLWSGYTLVGGLVIGGFLALQVPVLRYRAWQHAYRRLFERRAPVREWLDWEFSARAPGVPGTEIAVVAPAQAESQSGYARPRRANRPH